MADATYAQYAFSAGEWSPSKQGRVDDERYKFALAQCLNYIPSSEGSLLPRSGFRRIGDTVGGYQAKLLDFRFSSTEAYVAEVSDFDFRFWANGNLILEDTMNVASVSTGGPPVFTMTTNFPQHWVTDAYTVKLYFSSANDMAKAPHLVNREFYLHITGANTCTLTGFSGGPITDPVSATFTARLDLVFNGVTPSSCTYPDVQRILQYSSQQAIDDGHYATAPDHKAAILSYEFPPIAMSSARGVTKPFYEQFIDGPYLDSSGINVATVSGTTGEITVTLHGWADTTHYMAGDLTVYAGSIYVSLANANVNHTPNPVITAYWSILPSQWSSGTTYALGDVIYSTPTTNGVGTIYYSLQATNLNHTPATSGTWWSTTPAAYAGGTTYGAGVVVESGGIYYVSLAGGNVGNTPASSPTFWLPVDYQAAIDTVFNTATGWPATGVFSDEDADDTALSSSDQLGPAGRLFRLKVGPQPWSNRTTYATDDLVNFEDLIFKSLTAANLNNEPDQDAVHWEIQTLQIQWTWGRVKTFSDDHTATITVLGDDLRNGDPVYEYRFGLYCDSLGWPSAATYHEGRVVLAGPVPNRVDQGRSNLGFDFTPTAPDGTVADNNGIASVLNAEGNEHVVNLASNDDGIVVHTDIGEWIGKASNLNDPITPTSIQFRRATTFSGSLAENVALTSSHGFIQGNRRRLLEYKHFADPSSYSVRPNASDLTKDCQHLTVQGLTHVAYQRIPQPVIWCNTGATEPICAWNVYTHQLFGIGYMRSPDLTYVAPFSVEHGQDFATGAVPNMRFMAVQYGAVDTKQYLYQMRFPDSASFSGVMEILEPPADLTGDDGSLEFLYVPHDYTGPQKALAASCFLDSAVSPCGFKGNLATTGVTFFGLWALRGKTVAFTINGKYIQDVTISANGDVEVFFTNGASTVSTADGDFSIYDVGQASCAIIGQSTLPVYYQDFKWSANGNTHIGSPGGTVTKYNACFGYKFRRRGKMMRPQVGSQNGPTFAKSVRMDRAGIYVDSAHEISTGTSFSNLVPVKLTKSGPKDVRVLGIADVTTGIFDCNTKGSYDFDGQMCWEQTEPYPGAILGVGGFNVVMDR